MTARTAKLVVLVATLATVLIVLLFPAWTSQALLPNDQLIERHESAIGRRDQMVFFWALVVFILGATVYLGLHKNIRALSVAASLLLFILSIITGFTIGFMIMPLALLTLALSGIAKYQ